MAGLALNKKPVVIGVLSMVLLGIGYLYLAKRDDLSGFKLTTDAVADAGSGGSSASGPDGDAAANVVPSIAVKTNAIWTWFTDQRAVHYKGNTYIGWSSSGGDLGITKWNHATSTATSFTLHASLEADDHDNVAVLIRPDGRILAMYSKHNDTSGIRYRISTNPEDITAWGSEVVKSSGISLPVSYSNPFYLSKSGRTYDYFRSGEGGLGTNPYGMIESSDDGATWSETQHNFLIQTGQRPYPKWVSNGVDRVDFITTNSHPNEGAASIYHFYGKLDGSNVLQFFKTDGTMIGRTVTPADLTLIYDGSSKDAWTWSIAYGSDGNPRALFTKYVTTLDQRFMFSRWDGSAWTTPVEIAKGGANLYAKQAYYSGGICFDSTDPDHVYLSTPVAGVREIQEWVTKDSGASWSKLRDITKGTSTGTLNARPYSPKNRADDLAVLWWSGSYKSYTKFNTDLKGAAASFTNAVGEAKEIEQVSAQNTVPKLPK